MRKATALVVSAALLVALAGCADLPRTVDNCVPTATSGPASSAISAPGTFGNNPKAKIPTPTVTQKVQQSILHRGSGPVLGTGDIANVQWTVYLGSNGAAVGSSGAQGFSKNTAAQATIGITSDTWGHYLSCAPVGSRVATVLTAKQLLGSAGAATQNGLKSGQSLVVITDIQKGFRGRATGTLQPLKSGMPSVVTSENGTPGITLDLQTPPSSLRYETLRKGSGATVKKGDLLLLQIQGVEWTTPAPLVPFFSTWKNKQPKTTPAVSIAEDASSVLDPGSVAALVGQTVGSQVLVVVPPKSGFPVGKAPQDYPTGGTLVFVYDILGIQ